LKDDKWSRKEKLVVLVALVSALAVMVYSTIFVFVVIPKSKIITENLQWNSILTFFTKQYD
jgi:hypothetical protein